MNKQALIDEIVKLPRSRLHLSDPMVWVSDVIGMIDKHLPDNMVSVPAEPTKEFREDFEKIMRDSRYNIKRNDFGEYIHGAVCHMWTGYCFGHRRAILQAHKGEGNRMMELEVRDFYVAFFSDDVDCYERYSNNLDLDNAKKFLIHRREEAPSCEWVILAVLDI